MKKRYFLSFILSIISMLAVAQNVQIFDENFETGGGTFFLNFGGPGSNTGNNRWIVDNNYTGGGVGFPNTISEDSTYGGTISFAPFGHYLHIYDAGSPYLDCLYNPANQSDEFAYTWESMCTLGIYGVSLNFFYTGVGNSPNAYGQVYYSRNNGPWTAVGPQYYGKYKWQYATITDPAFDNTSSLQFGFRWQNNAGSGSDTSSWGIDDINVVGTYDSVTHPINITCSTQDTVCQGAFLYINYKLSDSLCDGQYTIQLSNASGSFTTPLLTWVYWIYYPNDSGTVPVQIPTFGVPPGSCYKIRIIRDSPDPVIIGTASNCFVVIQCPNTITTLQPVVTMDTNAVCAGSVIDIPFYSTGTFNTYNDYWAELSDSAGNFTTYDTIGMFASSTTYDPSTGSLPGTVSGVLPTNIPAGCHYYVRIVSDTPTAIGTPWGPFCIQHCDIFTNNQQSILACITGCSKDPKGYSDTITYNVHKFDSVMHYSTSNKFEVQLLNSTNFQQVNTGGFGIVTDTVSGKIYVHVPCADSLTALGISAGLYYMRVVATSSSYSDSSLGSLVHLTIGEPADSSVIYSATGTFTFCAGDVGEFFAEPWDFTSQYYWFDNGSQFDWSQNPIFITLNGGSFQLQVQENSYGCYGPKSPPVTITIKSKPNVALAGPLIICEGDTALFSVPFTNNTYYTWRSLYASSIDTANNIAKFVFDTAGKFKVTVLALDSCGADSTTRTIQVKPAPVPTLTGNTTLCKGAKDVLTAGGGTSYTWSPKTGLSSTAGATVTASPTVTTSYIVQVSNGTCAAPDTIKITVVPSPTVTVSPTSHLMCPGDTVMLTASGASRYYWTPDISLNNDTLATVIATPTTSVTYMVVGTSGNNCTDSATSAISVDVPKITISSAVSIIDGQNVTLFSSGGGTYSWTPPGSLSCTTCPDPTATPSVTTTYSLIVTDSLGCRAMDTVTVEVEPECGAIFVPEAFSPNGDGKNDVLYVRNNCIKDLDFIVYDRWGNKIFESTDPNIGWDGTYNGKPMNTGSYAWYVNVLTVNNKTMTAKGNVTLVR